MRLKTILLPVFLLLLLFAFGCNETPPPAAPKIGVVDSTRAFQESKAGKEGVAYLDGVGKEMQAELIKLQENLVKDDSDASRDALQKGFGELQQRFGAEQQQVMNKVTESYQKAVDTLRTQEGMVLILGTEAAVSYDPKADVTQKVIDLMNASPVTFERIQPESGAAEPSANGTSTVAPSTNATSPSTNGTQPQPSANGTAKP